MPFDQLRNAVGLRGYGSNNPVVENKEGFRMFNDKDWSDWVWCDRLDDESTNY